MDEQSKKLEAFNKIGKYQRAKRLNNIITEAKKYTRMNQQQIQMIQIKQQAWRQSNEITFKQKNFIKKTV